MISYTVFQQQPCRVVLMLVSLTLITSMNSREVNFVFKKVQFRLPV